MMRIILVAMLLTLAGCGTTPKAYNAEKVDCHYQRDGVRYKAECTIEGAVEVGRPSVMGVLR